MPKQQRRKPAKRKWRHDEPVDAELIELAVALDEFRGDRNAANWFSLPWLRGINAARLAATVAQRLLATNPSSTRTILHTAIAHVQDPVLAATYWYWQCDDLIAGIRAELHVHDRATANATIVALQCLQRSMTNSDAGGTAYNHWLLTIEPTEAEVLKWRCYDAIGVGPTLEGDHLDKARRAFTIAWKRGLFLTAYAIPSSKV